MFVHMEILLGIKIINLQTKLTVITW